jgi:hypothetical protein
MKNNKVERRQHERFEVPGAFLSYKKASFLFFKKNIIETYCPVQNLSLGGAKILCRRPIKPGARLMLRIMVPEDNLAFDLKGRLAWIYPIQERDFAFLSGIQFVQPSRVLADLQKKYAPDKP